MFGNYKKLELKMMEYIDREISRKCPLKCVGVYHTGALVEKIDWLNKRIDKLEKGIYDTNTTRSLDMDVMYLEKTAKEISEMHNITIDLKTKACGRTCDGKLQGIDASITIRKGE